MFESLYASLRQVIIERIRDELVPRKYHDPYHPVQVILELNHTQLAQSMADSCEVWSTIPEHLLEYRRLNPLAHVDPDTPPPRELVRAIGYLKQNHLAGNLLGEWQMPLPSAEVFIPQACSHNSSSHLVELLIMARRIALTNLSVSHPLLKSHQILSRSLTWIMRCLRRLTLKPIQLLQAMGS